MCFVAVYILYGGRYWAPSIPDTVWFVLFPPDFVIYMYAFDCTHNKGGLCTVIAGLCTCNFYFVYLQLLVFVPAIAGLCTCNSYFVYLPLLVCVPAIPILCTCHCWFVYLQFLFCVPAIAGFCTCNSYFVYL